MAGVSVITAAYIDTVEKLRWLGEAIQSVCHQSFQDWEMVIVDDCSPVSLDGVIADFANEPRVKFYRASRQQGPSLCRNTAAALATTKVLYALDADDRLTVNALSTLYQVFRGDPSLVVYGDIQRLERAQDGSYELGQVIKLPDYTFRYVMDLNGIIPVSAMHSVECHHKAGGWKPAFDSGLEDVEYWISAGKAGFCGKHVDSVALEYRRHDQSRAYKMRVLDRRLGTMRNAIREMHRDIYEEGSYPMGCCSDSPKSSSTGAQVPRGGARPARLDDLPASDKVWVQYIGKRQADFGIVSKAMGITYQIQGTGFIFEVHRQDAQWLQRLGRGKDFLVGVPAPVEAEAAPVPQAGGSSYQPPVPSLAELLTREPTRVPERVEEGLEPEPAVEEAYPVSALALGDPIDGILAEAGWTVRALAQATEEQVQTIHGIGPARARVIIHRARELVEPV